MTSDTPIDRAAEAVREIVRKWERLHDEAIEQGRPKTAAGYTLCAEAARECLAAVEAQR